MIVMKKYILFVILSLCFSLVTSAQTLTRAKKQHMIDSAFDARSDRYLRRCFPDYTIQIKYQKDTFELCSIETVLLVAPGITENQMVVLEGFMTTMANYYVSRNEPVYFDFGMIPADVDDYYNKMFRNKRIYVGSPVGSDIHPHVAQLFTVFNHVTDNYLDHRADSK
jgi:hypothetical protein